jgi:hypothetical protein
MSDAPPPPPPPPPPQDSPVQTEAPREQHDAQPESQPQKVPDQGGSLGEPPATRLDATQGPADAHVVDKDPGGCLGEPPRTAEAADTEVDANSDIAREEASRTTDQSPDDDPGGSLDEPPVEAPERTEPCSASEGEPPPQGEPAPDGQRSPEDDGQGGSEPAPEEVEEADAAALDDVALAADTVANHEGERGSPNELAADDDSTGATSDPDGDIATERDQDRASNEALGESGEPSSSDEFRDSEQGARPDSPGQGVEGARQSQDSARGIDDVTSEPRGSEVPIEPTTLPDGRDAIIVGNHEECTDRAVGAQQYADCGVVSCANVANEFGQNITEDQAVTDAVQKGLCDDGRCDDGSIDYDRLGASSPESRQEILREYGIDSQLVEVKSLEDIAQPIENGQGEIICVNAGELWDNDEYKDSGEYNHAVQVTGVARDDESGEILGFYVNDSGDSDTGGKGQFVSPDRMLAAAFPPQPFASMPPQNFANVTTGSWTNRP